MEFIISWTILGAVAAAWYYTKKQPNKKYRNIAIVVAVVGFVLFGILTELRKPQDTSSQQTTTTVASSTTSSSTSSSTSASSAESSSSSSSETSSSSSEPKYKTFDLAATQAYANKLQSDINGAMPEYGYTFSVLSNDQQILQLIVPQDWKYESKANIQRVADSVLEAKNANLRNWLAENGYDPSTIIHIKLKTDGDGTYIAEEGILGRMKVKVKN